MQVKKFEAKTIKEALQMVKQELGPEAVIISAKDNKKSFGLAGEGSVEVTAAITDKSLQKKQYAESRLSPQDKVRFNNQTAEVQKKFIDKTVGKYQAKKSAAVSEAARRASGKARARALTDLIYDEDSMSGSGSGGGEMQIHARPQSAVIRPTTGRRYIDIADEDDTQILGHSVEQALENFKMQGQSFQESDVRPAPARQPAVVSEDMSNLKTEVQQLRLLLSQLAQANNTTTKSVSRHPGAEYDLPFELAYQYEKLANSGIDTRYIVEILEKADKDLTGVDKKRKPLIDAWVARYIMSHTDVVGQYSQDGDPKLHLFLGPSGHGKTTMLVKMASHFVMNEKKKVAVFTTDNFKVGSQEQLKIFCQILNVPLENVRHSIEFEKLSSKYNNYDVILVDYPGFALRDISEIDQLRALMPHRDIPRKTHLVLGATSKDLDAYEITQRYNVTQYDNLILTKVDESFNHGVLYNIQRKTQKPIYCFGTGSRIPEDIEIATKERVLDLIYKITKNNF